MRFFHLADLHFGKSVYGLSMLDDQKYWVDRFLDICGSDRPDAVVIAGDVYDRANPSGDAVELLDRMLTGLSEMDIPVMMIAGNHDSGQRLAFARSLLSKQKLHIAGEVKKDIEKVTLDDPDGNGPVTFWLLPYFFTEQIEKILDDEDIKNYDMALRKLLSLQDIDTGRRNVMVSHQNVTAFGKEIERGGSESMVGGVGQIDYSAYDRFDYVALGHIHSSYHVGKKEIRYAGTPLCYHMEETRQKDKGVLEVTMNKKGEEVSVRSIPIEPLHRMRYLVGTVDEIYDTVLKDKGSNEYIGINITDRRITPEMNSFLRNTLEARGSLLLELTSSFRSHSASGTSIDKDTVENTPIEDLFSRLYTEQMGDNPPSDDEYRLMRFIGEITRNRDTHLDVSEKDIDSVIEKAKGMGGEDR